MRKESLVHKILRKLGFIKDIEDDRELKMEMCKRAIKANVCPEDCDICAWDAKGGTMAMEKRYRLKLLSGCRCRSRIRRKQNDK